MALVLLLLAALCVPAIVVEVTAGGEQPACRVWLRDVSTLTVSYVHSVERTPVRESYSVSVTGIRLREVRWQSFGYGLPDEYDDFEDGFYVKSEDVGLGRRLDYWFMPLNDARIAVGAHTVFEGLDEPARVSIRVRLVPLFVAVQG